MNIFSERCFPVQWAGPKRYTPPASTIEELPNIIDAVVISHTHYDHLDYNSVILLHKRYEQKFTLLNSAEFLVFILEFRMRVFFIAMKIPEKHGKNNYEEMKTLLPAVESYSFGPWTRFL